MCAYDLPLCDVSVTMDSNAQSLTKQGDVWCYYHSSKYLNQLYFYVAPPPTTLDYGSPCAVMRVAKEIGVSDTYPNTRGLALFFNYSPISGSEKDTINIYQTFSELLLCPLLPMWLINSLSWV